MARERAYLGKETNPLIDAQESFDDETKNELETWSTILRLDKSGRRQKANIEAKYAGDRTTILFNNVNKLGRFDEIAQAAGLTVDAVNQFARGDIFAIPANRFDDLERGIRAVSGATKVESKRRKKVVETRKAHHKREAREQVVKKWSAAVGGMPQLQERDARYEADASIFNGFDHLSFPPPSDKKGAAARPRKTRYKIASTPLQEPIVTPFGEPLEMPVGVMDSYEDAVASFLATASETKRKEHQRESARLRKQRQRSRAKDQP
jgi:hypothetical protein